MEIARMNYTFTAVLIILICLLTIFADPAYPRNEYLNEYGARCGDFETRIEAEDRNGKYNHYNDNNNYRNDDDNYRLSFTYRKYLGVDCKTINENVKLKQQLELMKMCGRVNNNPSLAHNENFRLLVSKCRGVSSTETNNRPDNSGSAWDDLKNDYKKENPDITLMGDKFIEPKKKLKIPKYLTDDSIVLPLPKPTNETE